jgi:hypothetical protein
VLRTWPVQPLILWRRQVRTSKLSLWLAKTFIEQGRGMFRIMLAYQPNRVWRKTVRYRSHNHTKCRPRVGTLNILAIEQTVWLLTAMSLCRIEHPKLTLWETGTRPEVAGEGLVSSNSVRNPLALALVRISISRSALSLNLFN